MLAETGRACPMGIEFGPEGELYVVDNQNWAAGNGPNGEINQGRILRLRLGWDKLVETIVVAKGISHPNGLRYRNGQVYVTVSKLPKVKRPDGLMVSAVYRFPANGHDIQVKTRWTIPTSWPASSPKTSSHSTAWMASSSTARAICSSAISATARFTR